MHGEGCRLPLLGQATWTTRIPDHPAGGGEMDSASLVVGSRSQEVRIVSLPWTHRNTK
jgi:hypothetical protein